MVKIIVLSLDTEIGKERRDKLNYEFEIDYGNTILDLVDPEIIRRMRKNEELAKLHRVKCCHFDQYIKLLKRIVNEKIDNVIICEDDAILRYIPTDINSEVIEEYEPILLNGKLAHPRNWKYNTNDYINNYLKPEINNFKKGINKIDYDKYRWSCCACIFYPSYRSAQKILNYFKNDKKSITYMDLWMSKNKLIKYLYYPSVFIINDGGVSQVADHNHGVICDYVVKK